MKPQDQRIAIAEACGWKDAEGQFPDYLNDLNAMREAESTLGSEIWDFAKNLESIVHPEPTKSTWAAWAYCCTATAAQHAEAFLKTIGKWKD